MHVRKASPSFRPAVNVAKCVLSCLARRIRLSKSSLDSSEWPELVLMVRSKLCRKVAEPEIKCSRPPPQAVFCDDSLHHFNIATRKTTRCKPDFAKIMGFTNVHHAFELLRNAGGEQCTPAILPDFQKFVTMIGQYFEQEELDAFSEALRHPTKDVWLHRNDSKHVLFPGLADAPIDRPSVRTSSGLKKGHRPAVRRNNEPEDTTPEPALAFVLVIRGKSAALCSKVRILYTLNLAAAAM